MSKYIDIKTRQEYETIPEGKVLPVFVNGLPVTLEAYDEYHKNNPTLLEEVVITPSKSTTLASYYDRMANVTPLNYINHINSLKEDERIRKANFWLGILNAGSLNLYVGAARNYYLNDLPFWSNVWYGNSGWIPEKVAAKYPVFSFLVNTGLDVALAHNLNRFYNWGTTSRLIGEGASKQAYSAPFWRKVYYRGGDPEYMREQSTLPKTLPYKFEGYDLTGQAIHSAPKVRMVSKPSKKLIRKLAEYEFYPTKVYDDPGQTVFVNPRENRVILDTEWSKNWLVDPEVLSIPDYINSLKKGGKLNATK